MLTRYLTEKEPARRILARFSQEYSQLQAKYAALKQSSGELTLENQNLTDELAKITQDLKALTVEHDHLKRDSGQYLELKTKYARAVKSAAETQARAEKIEKELAQLYSSEINTGLLYGGGLIVLGFITGYIVKRPKRRIPLI